MSNIVNPKFSETFYKGQDIVNYGAMIPLDMSAEVVLAKLSRNAERNIGKYYSQLGFTDLLGVHLPELRKMWFDPNDPTFPMHMLGLTGFIAYDMNTQETLGGIIWKRAGDNLFLYQLIASEKGKTMQVPTCLIWRSWLMYSRMKGFIPLVPEINNIQRNIKNLDIGVSYNPNRQRFMQNFAVKTYPVILKPPFYKPVITLSPFRSMRDLHIGNTPQPYTQQPNITYVPRASYGLYAILKHLDLSPNYDIVIVKTFAGKFIPACVTQQIEKVCKWHLLQDGEALAGQVILILHEFGIPAHSARFSGYFSDEWIKNIQKDGAVIIEDCVWRDSKVYPSSKYAIFSAQKMLNMNHSGWIEGIELSDEYLWSIGCLDTFKRQKCFEDLPYLGYGLDKRRRNWLVYNQLVLESGMMPDDRYKYEQAVKNNSWMPTVYMQKFNSEEEAIDIKARLEEFGIQAGMYWGEPVLYLPIHQNMHVEEVKYMFAVVSGYYNLCRDYTGNGK